MTLIVSFMAISQVATYLDKLFL